MLNPTDVSTVVSELARVLAQPKPTRRGTLAVRYLKCNKPGCLCAQRDDARHGPYTSVVRVVAGRTQSRRVPAERANERRRQVEAGQQFRQHIDAYWRACEQWADAQLDASATRPPDSRAHFRVVRPSVRRDAGTRGTQVARAARDGRTRAARGARAAVL